MAYGGSISNGIFCGEFSYCGKCEKCICKRFIHDIEGWFSLLSYRQKLAFFLGLIKRCNTTLVGCLLSSVRLSDGKERIYSMSKTNPQLDDMNEPPLRNNIISSNQDMNMSMISVFLRFLTFTDYQKKIVLFHFLKLSEDRLLANLSSQMYNIITEEGIPSNFSNSDSSDQEKAQSDSEKSATELPTPHKSDPSNDDDIHNAEPMSNYESEDDGFAIEEEEDDMSTLKASPRPSSSSSKVKKSKKNKRNTIPMFNPKSGKDFISALPIGIAKRIFGYLDKSSLTNCLCVSSVWRQLAEEVRSEVQVQGEVTESVKLMQRPSALIRKFSEARNLEADAGIAESSFSICALQITNDQVTAMGSTGQLCNPRYARFTDVLVPNYDVDTGRCIADPQPKQIDENSPIYTSAYQGFSTRKVIMEERNIYCGPFNVMVVHDQPDKFRTIHNDGGTLIASGSRNRLINLYDLTTGQELDMTLEGHSGSVRCIRISSADNLVFSGSYDTGIRVWNLSSGRFTKTFNGHQATVLCLGYENQLIVSGSVDRTCRVWSLKSLRCIRKFYHRSAVTAVAIRTAYMEERIISGDIKGHIKVWNLRTGRLIKVLHGHQGEVCALDVDRWFIISGSKDNYVMGWSNQGDHRHCLFAFAHPNHVLSVSLRFLRVISGCADGRIRIWSAINGNCVKVLRGNSRNDAIYSLDCRDNMLTINTESNVIVMKFEPIKYNYTTSELYLPNSSLKAKNAQAIRSDSELDRFDSNGELIGGNPRSRPHSAVRATRMHVLKCASREISGSRASLRSISPGEQKGRSASSESKRRPTSSLSSRPNTCPEGQSSSLIRRRSSRKNDFVQRTTFLQDPQKLASMLDHRCYPLRHCDLEAAKRIQFASTLPPWRKDEADAILKDVREQHRRLVEKRRSIRQQRADAKKQAELAALEAARLESEGTGDEDFNAPSKEQQAQFEEEKQGVRRMTWSFHRSHVTSASTYTGSTPLTEIDDLDLRPQPQPAPRAPSLNETQSDLRRALVPGTNPPALSYVRVAVAETMRQNRDEVVRQPPIRVLATGQQLQRHNSISLHDKTSLQSLTGLPKERSITNPKIEAILPGDGAEKRVTSAQKLRKIILDHKKENELRARSRSNSARLLAMQDAEQSPEELAAIEAARLREMAAQLESGGFSDGAVQQYFREVERNPVKIHVLPSPVPQTVFQGNIETSIPRPVSVEIRRKGGDLRRKTSSSATPLEVSSKGSNHRPPSTIIRPVSEPLQMGADPLMRVSNMETVLDRVKTRADILKKEHAKEALKKADSRFDYRITEIELAVKAEKEEADMRPSTAHSTRSSMTLGGIYGADYRGPKPLVLHNPAVYERQVTEANENNSRDALNKQRKLETWRRKKWSLLATGKITPNQLHGN